MNQYQVERRLCLCYALTAFFMLVCLISIAIPYHHWKTNLNVCPGNYLENTNCGCIFFGVSTTLYFNGGHISYCLYAIIAPIPVIAYAAIMGIFHMYRVCINNVGEYEDEKSTAMEEIEGESIVVRTRSRVAHKNDSVIYCWIPNACISAVLVLYTLIHASIITHGFVRTCNQFRIHTVREIISIGDQASVIHFRLSCSAIFDFMDYLLKDPTNSRRGELINTGASLQIALFTAWVSVALLIVISVLSSIRAHKERHVLTCCGN